jgi:hypothetical protein
MFDAYYQTSAQTSCCSLPHLALASTAPNSNGLRSWANSSGANKLELVPALSWGNVLKDIGCSAGEETQDSTSATPGLLNWHNVSVCGHRALCMPYETPPPSGNETTAAGGLTTWAFRCECKKGLQVNPEIPGVGQQWNPLTMCTEHNYKGWFQSVAYGINAVFFISVVLFACDTMRRLRQSRAGSAKKGNRGCCGTRKLTVELSGIILLNVLFSVFFCSMLADKIQTSLGQDYSVVLQALGSLSLGPTLLIAVLNTLVVATTWVHVASNAKAFRKTTPGSAKRRVRIFIWIMASFATLGFVLAFIIDDVLIALSAITACVVIAIVYLVGSCKLQAVIEAKMNGEGLSSVPSTKSDSGGRGSSTPSRTKPAANRITSSFVKRQTNSWVGRSGGPGGKKRHKHLETIVRAGWNYEKRENRERGRAQRERGRGGGGVTRARQIPT